MPEHFPCPRVGVLLLLGFVLTGCGSDSSEAPEDSGDGGSSAEVRVVGSSYCQPDPVVGNIDFVLQLENLGDAAAEGISVKLIHRDAAGNRKAPLGDTLIDVSIPVHDTEEVNGTSGLGKGEEVTECAVALVGEGAGSSDEQPIEVR